MKTTHMGILSGVLLSTPLAIVMQTASAQALPGGTLDPTTIPKYVTDLVIPPVLYDDRDGERDRDDDKKYSKKRKDDDDDVEFVVAQRKIMQQILPPTDIFGNPLPPTPLWAYGNPRDPKTFSNPAHTIEVTKDNMTTVAWVNELVKNPKRCFDDDYEFDDDNSDDNGKKRKNKRACRYLPHIITDTNGDPIVDQTLHWAAPNQDCVDGVPRPDCRGASDQPYFGPIPMVVHVHGAHVGPGSDGYPEAWWLPNAGNIDCTNAPGYPRTKTVDDDFACNGTFFESAEGADTQNALGKGYAIDEYSNDQPTATLWYHDHTLGITRLNVYAGGAGFWLIRDQKDGETGLVSGVLPGPAPKIGQDPNCSRNKKKGRKGRKCVRDIVREIPIAIQPKSFNADGSQFYPADRAFFEEFGDGQVFNRNAGFDDNFPFLPEGAIPNPNPPPSYLYTATDIAPAWNPEAFFNTMVVNGKTWPKLDVAPERYRLRLLNASDGRFLNMALFVVNDDGTLGQEIPFYQIGAEQGLLPAVVRIETGYATTLPGDGRDVGSGVTPVAGRFAEQALLVGPAERADVIVDFTGLADGTVIRMINTGPDAPFGGFPFPGDESDPDTSGQVMQFVVDKGMPAGKDSTHPASLVLDTKPGGVPKFTEEELALPTTTVRDLALLEEESKLVCAEVDMGTGLITQVPGSPLDDCPNGGDPFGPQAAVLGIDGSTGAGEPTLWDEAIVTNPQVGDLEIWELYNNSADAHPIHLHLVKFQVIERVEAGGTRHDPEPWEMGWKDTVIAYPEGEVVRVAARFDIPGLYVWHCHLLSHEDNEMMVPFCVGDPDQDCPGAMF